MLRDPVFLKEDGAAHWQRLELDGVSPYAGIAMGREPQQH